MKIKKTLGILALGTMLSACGHYSKEHSVYFNSGSAMLTPSEKAQISRIASEYKTNNSIKTTNLADKKKVHVISYTDSVGSKKMNKKLSKKRADMVKNVLVKAGVKESNIKVLARGEGMFDGNKNDKSLRRVDVSIF